MIIKKYEFNRDFKKIIKLLKNEACFQEVTARKNRVDRIREGLVHSIAYVAYEGEELLGFVRAMEDPPYGLLVRELYVRPEDRGCGIAKILLLCLIERFPDDTIQVAFLDLSYAVHQNFPSEKGVYYLPKPEVPTTYLKDDRAERKKKKKAQRMEAQLRRKALYEAEEYWYTRYLEYDLDESRDELESMEVDLELDDDDIPF